MGDKPNLAAKVAWKVLEYFLIIFLSLSCGLGGSFLGVKLFGEKFKDITREEVTTQVVDEDSQIIDIVSQNQDAVVSIVISKNVPVYENYFSDPYSSDFFGFNMPMMNQKQVGEEEQQIGAGSGFVVTEDGMIVTNRHVVEDEEASYTVILNDGEKLDAKVLARDTYLDLAVLKVDKQFDQVIKLGDSGSLKVGQRVLAIGNSLGEYSGTVSSGIISGLSRQVLAGDGYGMTELLDGVIQTDAAINPGNSGGPLLDINGNAIGINVAMASGAENVAFSIPINNVKSAIESVKENGKIIRPYLGVRYIMINDEVKKANQLDIDYGALVTRGDTVADLAVIPGSPADKAGIVENDIILEIDGVKLDENASLQNEIQRHAAGDEVELKVWHKGDEKTVKVKLENQE